MTGSTTKQSILPLRGEMDCFASLAMTVTIAVLLAMTSLQFQIRLRVPAARCVRVLQEPFAQEIEGAGNAGAQCTRSLACKCKKHTSVVTTGHRNHSGIPRAMVLRLTSRSPRLPGLFYT